MNALLLYPEFPDTFWSFKHALKFIRKKASLPPLGLLTVAAMLPAAWSHNNPVDVLAGSGPGTYAVALDALLSDPTVDALLVIMAPNDWFLPASLAEVICEVAAVHQKPVMASIMGMASVDQALAIYQAHGLGDGESAFKALNNLTGLYKETGRNGKAEETARRVFEMAGRLFGHARGSFLFMKRQLWIAVQMLIKLRERGVLLIRTRFDFFVKFVG